MYDATTLTELMRIIIERGMSIDTEQGFAFKLHEKHPNAPRSPVKFNLATPQFRKGGRLNEDDLLLMGRLLWDYAKRNRIPVLVLAGVPNVGEGLARALQKDLENETGLYVPLVPMHKVPGSREIAPIEPSMEDLPSRLVLQIDDVLTWGHSALEAAARLKEAHYLVKHFLAVLDYGLGGRDTMADEAGIEARGIVEVMSVVEYGLEMKLIPMHHVDAIRRFYADMRAYTAEHRLQPHALASS